jgi:hypothetical protein
MDNRTGVAVSTLIRVTSTSTRPIASFPSTSSPMAQQKESPLFPDDSGLINPFDIEHRLHVCRRWK